MSFKGKPILCLDFDGVIHSYTSGWKGADVIPDPPVDGALKFIVEASEHFEVHIYSSRSNKPGGILAMQRWLEHWYGEQGVYKPEPGTAHSGFVPCVLRWPKEKPPAMVTIDDRALTFTGTWPTIEELQSFKPWNRMQQAMRTLPLTQGETNAYMTGLKRGREIEASKLKTFIAEHAGYTIGGFSVVIAESKEDAKYLLSIELEQRQLSTNDITLTEVDSAVGGATMIFDGEY